MTTKRIRRFNPVQVAKVAGVLYGMMGLLLLPIFYFAIRAAPSTADFNVSMGVTIAIPFLYACFGAVASMIGAALYNLVAGWTGGIEVEVE